MMGWYEDAKMVVAVASALDNIGVSPSLGDLRSVTGDLKASGAIIPVRCKDCAYWQDNNGGYPHEECRWGRNETPDADDFCSYGERKDGDGNG